MTATPVTVVGGGITGMAAAWELVNRGAAVTLVESSSRLGGKIVGGQIGGRWVDLGPDAFLARLPDAVQLCQELGLGRELVGAATESASLWSGGRLRRLPRGTVLGVPAGLRGLRAVAGSGILSPAGVARAALDLVLPRRDLGKDPSVGDLVTARLGRQVHDRLVGPLVGGIHAGATGRLSAVAVTPQLVAAAGAHRSLVVGLRRQREAAARSSSAGNPAARAATFVSIFGGMSRLVTRLEEELRAAGVVIELGTPIDRLPAGRGITILTTPAPVTSALLAEVSPTAATELAQIEHASVVLTIMRYPLSAFPGGTAPNGSGFLVPRREGLLMTACSFASSKWPHWGAPSEVVLRVSAGRWGDERAMDFGDAELVARLHRELARALGLRGEPLETRVTRWPAAFPQYTPGHLARVEHIEAALASDCPEVLATGAAFRGVGIPACIAQGRAAARRALGP
ncbi:MAG TPA: protoporphyrinogen oxidase [Acidimicrobiales bacterium]|nr:protoporphyrinogen oxidase [Acidimicrobiales bacterium]